MWLGLAEFAGKALDPDGLAVQRSLRTAFAQSLAARCMEEKVVTDPREAECFGSILGFGAVRRRHAAPDNPCMGAARFVALARSCRPARANPLSRMGCSSKWPTTARRSTAGWGERRRRRERSGGHRRRGARARASRHPADTAPGRLPRRPCRRALRQRYPCLVCRRGAESFSLWVADLAVFGLQHRTLANLRWVSPMASIMSDTPVPAGHGMLPPASARERRAPGSMRPTAMAENEMSLSRGVAGGGPADRRRGALDGLHGLLHRLAGGAATASKSSR